MMKNFARTRPSRRSSAAAASQQARPFVAGALDYAGRCVAQPLDWRCLGRAPAPSAGGR